MTVIEHLVTSIRNSSKYNPDVQASPSCIIWPDKERQWESVISKLQSIMPELLVLGAYQPDKKTGPSIWIRCAIAGTLSEPVFPPSLLPVIYLPGISRLDILGGKNCKEDINPIVFLQYLGCMWLQPNTKDWTLYSWLKSDDGGLALDVDSSKNTKSALQIAINALLDEKIDLLRNHHLDAAYFNTLLTGGDSVRDLLTWMENDNKFRSERQEAEWKAFNEVCKANFLFSPEKEGILIAAERLAVHNGSWKSVWDRFCEAPKLYPHIPEHIRKCKKPEFDLFADEQTTAGWPQWNEEQEADLRKSLMGISKIPEHKAREQIQKLRNEHGARRNFVWTDLGYSPYAVILETLSTISELTSLSLSGGTEQDIIDGYQSFGWKIDDAVISVLSKCETNEVFEAASVVIRALYYPWAESCALHLQEIWNSANFDQKPIFNDDNESCIIFVDGLRYDCAKRLSSMLTDLGFTIQEKTKWAPLPTVTGTGKPAAAPLIRQPDCVSEDTIGYNFEILTTHQLRKIIEDNGYTIYLNDGSPIPAEDKTKKLWIECGDIDHEGHSRGWKLAKQIDIILKDLTDLITTLSKKGWKRVKIVTDHGWLLVPGGLNKVNLPAVLADTKWGRCAMLKQGSSSNERLFPWYWNSNQYFALANGIDCFKAGQEYTHGGLSVQEALVMHLTVINPGCGVISAITDVSWKGLVCKVQTEGQIENISIDIRKNPGDPESSIVKPRLLKSDGTVTLFVEDDSLEGEKIYVVSMTADGTLAAQSETIIGGGY